MFDVEVAKSVIARVARTAAESMKKLRRVTQLGYGLAKVEQVASTRRVLTDDGKLRYWRPSCPNSPDGGLTTDLKDMPEGLIDPYIRLFSFWDGNEPLAAMTYYACHPCAFYGGGEVTSEIPGLARAARDAALPGVMNIHFNGAGGNVAVGKYNDGTPAAQPRLAKRLDSSMKAAWESQEKLPCDAHNLNWRVCPVRLPVCKEFNEAKLLKVIDDPRTDKYARVREAYKLAWLRRDVAGRRIDIGRLRIGPVYVLHMPGELFVEYQLTAQRMRPDKFVCMAAYGDWGPAYIGTKAAYSQGGYEAATSNVAPELEDDHILDVSSYKNGTDILLTCFGFLLSGEIARFGH
jgi:hypothetical protein